MSDDEQHDQWAMMSGGPSSLGLGQRQAIIEGRTGVVAGCFLYGGLFAIFFLLYLFNYNDPQVHCFSYRMAFHVISILCALFFENTQSRVLKHHIIVPLLGEHPHPKVGCGKVCNVVEETIDLFPFVFWFLMIRYLACLCKNSPADTFMVHGFVAHVSAFMAVELWHLPQDRVGEWLEAFDPDGEIISGKLLSFFWYISVPFVSIALYNVMSKFSKGFQQTMSPQPPGAARSAPPRRMKRTVAESTDADAMPTGEGMGMHEHEHTWEDLTLEAEEESSAIVFGFLVKQLGLRLCKWFYPTYAGWGWYNEYETFLVHSLLLYTSVIGVSFLYSIWTRAKQQDEAGTHRWECIEAHLAMAFAWCWTYLMKYWVGSLTVGAPEWSPFLSPTISKSVSAVIATLFAALCVVVLDKCADAGMVLDSTATGLIPFFGLTVGLSWETCFASGTKAIIKNTAHITEAYPAIFEILLCTLFMLLVMPGWRWYIVPEAMKPVPKRKVES